MIFLLLFYVDFTVSSIPNKMLLVITKAELGHSFSVMGEEGEGVEHAILAINCTIFSC